MEYFTVFVGLKRPPTICGKWRRKRAAAIRTGTRDTATDSVEALAKNKKIVKREK